MRKAVLLTALLLVAGPGAAQTAAMDAARAAGQIGERFDGYIGVASPVPGVVRSQVAAVNIQRRTLYSNLAASRGATPHDVGITAGCQLLGRVDELLAVDAAAGGDVLEHLGDALDDLR